MRNLNCLFGPIRVSRWLYEPLDGLILPALFPLERYLGIIAGVATPALADLVARLSVDFTQRQVLETLREQQHVVWGAGTLRSVTQAMAEGIAPFQHAVRVQMLLGWLTQAARESGPVRFTLAVGRDGLMLPIRGKGTYKEGATATVSVLDLWGQRLGTIYLEQMPESGQGTLSDELTRLLRDVLAQWQGATPRLAYITDAGFHPRDDFENVLCRMLDPKRVGRYLKWEWTVDYYHACCYVSLNTAVDVRRVRRAAATEEFSLLLEAARTGKAFRKLSGPDREMLYLLAVYTGLRVAELASLTARSFDLEADPPTVTVAAAYSKRRRLDLQPIRPDLADKLRDWLAVRVEAKPDFPLWPGTWHKRAAHMLRRDLGAARTKWVGVEGIDPVERKRREDSDTLKAVDGAGCVLDFHGLRHTFISNLAAAGVHPKEAQQLARHSTISLTMDRYTHLQMVNVTGALDKLPGLPTSTDAAAVALQATGTDGDSLAPVLAPTGPELALNWPSLMPRHYIWCPQMTSKPVEKAKRPTLLAGQSWALLACR